MIRGEENEVSKCFDANFLFHIFFSFRQEEVLEVERSSVFFHSLISCKRFQHLAVTSLFLLCLLQITDARFYLSYSVFRQFIFLTRFSIYLYIYL